ncbi:MAG: alpha/beta hydrolase [Clostridia bacterium]|nr:alpha/beta hydrolase [Clostridia bacterium]
MKHMTKRRIWIIAGTTLAMLLLVFGACAIYVFDYYRADEGAVVPFWPEENITVSELDGGDVVFEPQGATVGFIFYPGGKVDHNAYQPLLAALAREGILCVLVKMPLRLAVLDVNAADGIRESYPQITDWYIGGHSLGGSMAASYLEKHTDEYKGLVLLASYSTADLSDSELRVLSVYGTEDKVLDRKKYDENKSNLPSDFTEAVIAGGCHAYFGMYGAQDGDGVPTISNHEQIKLTVACILDALKKTEG